MSEFYGTLWEINGVKVISIPKNHAKFEGLEKGDNVKVSIRKHSVFKEE